MLAMFDYQMINPMKSQKTTVFLWFSYGYKKRWDVVLQPPPLQLHHSEWLKGGALEALISVAALHHDEPCLHVELEP